MSEGLNTKINPGDYVIFLYKATKSDAPEQMVQLHVSEVGQDTFKGHNAMRFNPANGDKVQDTFRSYRYDRVVHGTVMKKIG